MFAIDCEQGVDIQGKEHITNYRSSKWAQRGFCRHCGTHLYYQFLEGDTYAIPAGLFQDAENLRLTAQIFINKKPDYYALSNETATMTEEEVFAMYSKQE